MPDIGRDTLNMHPMILSWDSTDGALYCKGVNQEIHHRRKALLEDPPTEGE